VVFKRFSPAAVIDPPSSKRGSSASSRHTTSTFSLRPRLTPIVVILPIHNEQEGIQATFHQIQRFLYTHPHFTFIFVDDGSTDLTKTILSNSIRSAKNPQIQLLSYNPQAGKGYAVKTGMQAVPHCEYVCFVDGDLAYSLNHLEPMLEALQKADVVIGSRRLTGQLFKGVGLPRRLARQIFHGLARQFLNLPYADMQAGLKGFRQTAAQELFERQKLAGFSFDLELIFLAKKHGYVISEIPAQISEHHQRKISKVSLSKDAVRMLRDLVRIRFNDWLGRYR
jgi:dolichyl-phosphate beta-glucosyltransferase